MATMEYRALGDRQTGCAVSREKRQRGCTVGEIRRRAVWDPHSLEAADARAFVVGGEKGRCHLLLASALRRAAS